MTDTIKFTETFFSPQGEGKYVGIPSLWIRLFNCNLNCNGFGQTDPTDPATYDLPYERIDITDITNVEDLPVFDKGCDSSYTWSKRYKHLMAEQTVTETVDQLTSLLPTHTFVHTGSGQNIDLCITGGEPLLPGNQRQVIALLTEFHARGNMPSRITVETNGTRAPSDDLAELIERLYTSSEYGGLCDDESPIQSEWFWSVSPKLWNTAGEHPSKAIKPEVVAAMAKISNHGQLKFVVNGSAHSWAEVEHNVKLFREAGVTWPIYIMGVGGTLEGLKMTEAMICDEAIKRGYFYTSRVHVHLYGNIIGK